MIVDGIGGNSLSLGGEYISGVCMPLDTENGRLKKRVKEGKPSASNLLFLIKFCLQIWLAPRWRISGMLRNQHFWDFLFLGFLFCLVRFKTGKNV